MAREITADGALTWEDPPDGGHLPIIDPYEGCTVGCPYCFQLNDASWPRDVVVKTNMPDLIRRDLADWPKDEPVYVGSRCDPYMPMEGRYGLTRQCLSVLSDLRIPCFVMTKADPSLVSRDLDIMKSYQAEFTVALGLCNIGQLMEAKSSGETENIAFAHRLRAAGIGVRTFIMPVLPGITDVRLMMESLPADVTVWLHKLQGSADTRNGQELLAFIEKHYPHLADLYRDLLGGGEDVYFEELVSDFKDNPRVRLPYV